jgi:hypothetical protein
LITRIVARVNPIICLITFQRRRHCGDLGFSACACAFILHVAAGGQHQRRKNEDDHDNHQHFDDGDSAFGGE